MAGLKTIKQKIRATGRTRQVTRAMEAVSAAKMRKSQQRALAARSYARAAVSVLARVSGGREMQNHPLIKQNAPSRTLYIVVTSDKGLAGALNSGVLRKVASEIKPGDSVIAVGRKAQDFFTARKFVVEASHMNGEELSAETLDTIIAEAANRFAMGEAGLVRIAYQNFISTFEQRPIVRTLFPLSLDELQKVVEGIVPAKGAYATSEPDFKIPNYTVEPSAEEVLDIILPKLAGVFLYHALLESQASEHSARMVAMKSASDKALEMTQSLTLAFNKARQAAITREVSEIIGGMEAIA
jgi:F-type H+-transporting ATPase subunit gamma